MMTMTMRELIGWYGLCAFAIVTVVGTVSYRVGALFELRDVRREPK